MVLFTSWLLLLLANITQTGAKILRTLYSCRLIFIWCASAYLGFGQQCMSIAQMNYISFDRCNTC